MGDSYHFLGIGGIGMSALAQILLEKGANVSGIDTRACPHLQQQGIAFQSTLPKQGKVIYSTAIKADHPDLVAARSQDLSVLHRSELLQELLIEKQGILVAGTHGKTSTSALLTWTLLSAGLKPTFAVGGILRNLDTNGGFGHGSHFVAEADESDGSFMKLSGAAAIITNIEKEHLDYWKTETNLVNGFRQFINRIHNSEQLLWCSDDPLLRQLSPPGISYGRKGELSLTSYQQQGMTGLFTATFRGKVYADIEIPLLGRENALNALAVFGLALQLGVTVDVIRAAFSSYRGVKRRLEHLGESGRIAIYDDYAHHPTEIQSMLRALRGGIAKRRLVSLFQPHRYTRTRDHDFSTSFKEADLAIITDIHSAGEEPIKGISGQHVCDMLQHPNCCFIPKQLLLTHVPKILQSGDVLVTIGAGDITEIAQQITRRL